MLRIDNKYIATCGNAKIQLPIIDGRFLSKSGIKSIARTAVDVSFIPRKDGYVAKTQIIESIQELLIKMVDKYAPYEIVRISRLQNADEANTELTSLINSIVNRLCKEEYNSEATTSFEDYANSQQAVVLDGKLPRVDGMFACEVEAKKRLIAAKALKKTGKLSSASATGTGNPGRSFYLTYRDGYTVTEITNPLVREMHSKRRGVVNALKNCVNIIGANDPYVEILDLEQLPPLTNAIVACLPIAGDDSVIISESLVYRLTAIKNEYKYHDLDSVINYRGGYRHSGRNGRLDKREPEIPVTMAVSYSVDGERRFERLFPEKLDEETTTKLEDAAILMELRLLYMNKYDGMIEKLGAYSYEEMKHWREWLIHQTKWIARNNSRSVVVKNIERIVLDSNVMYREFFGVKYLKPEVGMKIQSCCDLFKGVVSKILPDNKMPLVKIAGKIVRAEVVCEMNASTKKHNSLRFAHGQMALNAIAKYNGRMGIVGYPTLEEVIKIVDGIYEDDSLTCEVLDSTGEVSLGRYPAGVVRIGRHKQDPSIVSAVKGGYFESNVNEQNSVKSGGVVCGLVDTYCLLAAGLTETAKEFRQNIPTKTMMKLEVLRGTVQ